MKNKKRLLLLPLLALTLAGCDNNTNPQEETPVNTVTLTLESDALQIIVGGQKTLVVTATGAEGNVTWTSSDTSVLTVSDAGKIEALKAGTSTVTASYGGKTATCTVTVINFSDVYIMSVSKNDNIKTFEDNVKNEIIAEGKTIHPFRGQTSNVIEVGDDNAFVMKPDITIVEKETLEDVDESIWTLGYSFTIKEKVGTEYVTTTTDYGVFDNEKCSFDFNEDAIGKEFQLSVMPNGLSAQQQAAPAYTTTVNVKVSNGYNVYKADELAYFNDVNFSSSHRQNTEIGKDYSANWKAFRKQKGLDEEYVAPSIFLQNNIVLTKDNLPKEFFYETNAEGYLGKMKDGTDCYARYSNGFTFNGNYFNIDTAGVPVCGVCYNDDGISHTTLFKVYENRVGDDIESVLTFKNCSYFGNGENGNDETKKLGLIFFKISGEVANVTTNLVVNATFDNFNVKAATISFYAEYVPSLITIKDCVVTDGYANSIYLYKNGDLNIVNSEFRKFGGPIIVTNGAGDPDEVKNGFHVTVDEESVLENWVSGQEAWFVQTHANMAIDLITGSDVLFNQSGLTFLTSESLMNCILVNYEQSPYVCFTKGNTAKVGIDKLDPNASDIVSSVMGSQTGVAQTNATQENPLPTIADLMMANQMFGFIHFVVELMLLPQE